MNRFLLGFGLVVLAAGAQAEQTAEREINAALFAQAGVPAMVIALRPCGMDMELSMTGATFERHTRAQYSLEPLDFAKARITRHNKGPEVLVVPWRDRQRDAMLEQITAMRTAQRAAEDEMFALKLPKDEEKAQYRAIQAQFADAAAKGSFGADLARNLAIITIRAKGKPDQRGDRGLSAGTGAGSGHGGNGAGPSRALAERDLYGGMNPWSKGYR